MRKLLSLGLIALATMAGCSRRPTPLPTATLIPAILTPTVGNTVEAGIHREDTATPSHEGNEGVKVTGGDTLTTTVTATLTPPPTPIPTVVRPAPGPLPTTYVVRAGDNLFRISWRFGVSLYTIAAVNSIRNIHYIRVGQVLCIPTPDGRCAPQPAPAAYVVRMGDTLYSIARRYGTTVEALVAANGLTGYRIEVGQVLRIPGGGGQPCLAGQYRVRTGDTVYSIARTFHTTVEAIVSANGLVNYRINVGQCLTIPGTPVPTATGTPVTPTPTVTGTPPTATPTTTPGTPAAPGEVNVYTSVEGGFSVEYPKGWAVETRDDSLTGYKAWLFKEAGDTAGVTGVIVMPSPAGDASVVLVDARASLTTLVPGRFGGGATVDWDFDGDGAEDTPKDEDMDHEPAKQLLAKVKDSGGTHVANLYMVAAVHAGRGYVYFATAPLSTWNQWSQRFTLMFKSMTFR